jgi:hypothetical protein
MKIYIRILWYIIFSSFLFGCWDKDEELFIEPVGKLNYTIEVDLEYSYWRWNYYKYNSDTLLIKIIVKDDVKELGEHLYEYNKNKQLITVTQTGPHLSYNINRYFYDEKGRLVEVTPFYKYFYDSLDRLEEKIILNSDISFRYEYDSLFRDRIKCEKYYLESVGPDLAYSVEYKYDDSGNLFEKYLVSDSWMYDSGILETMEYNNKNQLVKKTIYNRKVPPFEQSEISYIYF